MQIDDRREATFRYAAGLSGRMIALLDHTAKFDAAKKAFVAAAQLLD